MLKTTILSLIGIFFLATSSATGATKVFLLGGQSNMAGVGGYPGPTYPADDPCPDSYSQPLDAVKFWNYGNAPATGVVNNPTTGNGWVSLQTGFGYTGDEFGPELGFGHRLHELYPNDDIYLVKYGITSTSLAVHWNPDGSGARYNTFKSRVNAALQELLAAGKQPVISGMIWMQGESDAANGAASAAAYGANLANFIDKVRSDFATPNMRFVIGEINDYAWGTAANNALVRNAQLAIPDPASGSLYRANTACFNTDSLERAYWGHFGTQGQIDLGIEFADAIAAPEPSTAKLTTAVLLGGGVYFSWRRWRPYLRRGCQTCGLNDLEVDVRAGRVSPAPPSAPTTQARADAVNHGNNRAALRGGASLAARERRPMHDKNVATWPTIRKLCLPIFAGLAFSALCGCGPSNPLGRQAISGKIDLDGLPLDRGAIQFTPCHGTGGVGSGGLISGGRYEISAAKGLPPGKYRVGIYSPEARSDAVQDAAGAGDVAGRERIPSRYNSATTLTVDVTADGRNDFDFSIRSK